MRRVFFLSAMCTLMIFFTNKTMAQTILTVTNAQDTGTGSLREVLENTQLVYSETFESGNGASLLGWNFVNNNYNKWIVGTDASYSGNKSAYISYSNSSNTYNLSYSSVSHLYHDITFPASTSDFVLTFKWRCYGQSSYDNLQIFVVPNNVTPVAGSEMSGSYKVGNTYYAGYSTWQTASIILPAATYTGTSKRLVFSWKNNNSGGTQPPAAIDDVEITYTTQMEGNIIVFDPSIMWTDSVLTLASSLPNITNNLTIEGNGITISGNNMYGILNINSGNATVNINRVHFTQGKTSSDGGAIWNNGNLTLNSCIFSYNQSIGYGGGAIYNQDSMFVQGCTFYGNNATNYGGAMYSGNGAITLTGNLFFDNTDGNGYNVVYRSGGTIFSGGYNVSDRISGTSALTGSGFTFTTGDTTVTVLSVLPATFRPLQGNGASGLITTLSTGYPVFDFYGDSIVAPATAGAVQNNTANCLLSYSSKGFGTVIITDGTTPDTNDIVPQGSSITLTAIPDSGYNILYWTVNGSRQAPTADTLLLIMDKGKEVVAVFGIIVTNAQDAGTGSLREAITTLNIDSGSIIFAPNIMWTDSVLTLASSLPNITNNLTIEGNGITISGNDMYGILNINSGNTTVNISRVHFTQGKTSSDGGAIWNNGNLTLSSCIFSYNQSIGTSYGGGAVYNQGHTLVMQACTFYGNNATNYGGVIYSRSGTITLTGNLFYDNTDGNGYNVVYYSVGTVISGGYNVSDRISGMSAFTGSGFTFTNGDTTVTTLSVLPATFRPLQGNGATGIITTLPKSYPIFDFYGDSIIAPATAGAVQNNTANCLLSYSSKGFGRITITAGTIPDVDGIVAQGSSVTFTAIPNSGYSILYWIVNGSRQAITSNTLSLIVDESKEVIAVFGILVTNAQDTGTGSLRKALENKQTINYSETFESGSGTSLSGWRFISNSYNLWIVGTDAYYSGSKGAYISNNSSNNTYSYNSTTYYNITSVSHLYHDITFPASTSTSDFVLTFKWRCYGEDNYDNLQIFVAPNTVTPVAGSEMSGSYKIGNTYVGYSTWQSASITLPAATYAGTSKCLVFSWKNNSSEGNQPPAAIDDVEISYTTQMEDNIIAFDPSIMWTDSVLTLASSLPNITNNLTIEGNGITISGNDMYRILNINSGDASVNISRVHFTKGKTSSNGGAIWNNGNLTLSSCIFSYNQSIGTSYGGGAIYNNSDTLTVRGCTFYNNSAYYGGTIYNQGYSSSSKGIVNLTGNLFYGNTATYSNNIVCNNIVSYATTTSYGYNMSDKYSGTDSANGSGFAFATGDKRVAALPISTANFRPIEGSGITGIITTLPTNYPTKDFYGNNITIPANAGAVQGTNILYIVTFNADSGSSIPVQQVYGGMRVTQPTPAPVKSGYVFVGWYKESACINIWNFVTDVVVSDTMLYAKWETAYNVIFNSNGGSSVTPQTVASGRTVTEPMPPPNKSGYSFAGWYKNANLTNLWNFVTDIVVSDTTLYAKWTVITYTVTFNSNGGSSVTPQTVTSGSTISEPAPPTKIGYIFAGWYKEANLTNIWNFATNVVVSNITLHAKWTERNTTTCTVIFNSMGGSKVPSQIVGVGNKVLEPEPPILTNYTFYGWYKEDTYINLWNFATDIAVSDTTLYAKWIQQIGIEYVKENKIVIYPNPAHEVLYIKSSLPIEQITIYDISGRMVQQLSNPEQSISINDFAAGAYFLKVQTTKGIIMYKIMIDKLSNP